jgi:hypothetical protein
MSRRSNLVTLVVEDAAIGGIEEAVRQRCVSA